MKKIKIALLAALGSIVFSAPILAGSWVYADAGWRYQNDDGSYKKNEWYTQEDKRAFYFGADGYLLKDTTTPDGYHVRGDGSWDQSPARLELKTKNFYMYFIESWIQKDSKDNNVVVFCYDYTNLSSDPNYPREVIVDAYQNGIQLDSAYLNSDEVEYAQNSHKKVMQGSTLRAIQCFKAEDLSPITFIINDLLDYRTKNPAPPQYTEYYD